MDIWPLPSLLICLLLGPVSFRVSLNFLNMGVPGKKELLNLRIFGKGSTFVVQV